MPSPPITIGELVDVPAFDSPIASPWAQEVSRRIVHRFATVAERDAKYPANTAGAGAVCAVAGRLYMSDGTAWWPIGEAVTPAAANNVWYTGRAMWDGGGTGGGAGAFTTTGWYARTGSMCWFRSTITFQTAPSPFGPSMNLPFTAATTWSGNFDLAGSILQPGLQNMPALIAARSYDTVGIGVGEAKQVPGAAAGVNIVQNHNVDSVTPFNWASYNGQSPAITVTGWYPFR